MKWEQSRDDIYSPFSFPASSVSRMFCFITK